MIRLKLTPEQQARVDTILRRASVYERKHVAQGYYIEDKDGRDPGEEWCRRHATQEAELLSEKEPAREWEIVCVDNSANHDSPYRCEKCGKYLYGWLTDYGAEEELEYLETEGFNARKGEHCYLWMLCENSFLQDSDEYRRLLKLAGIEA